VGRFEVVIASFCFRLLLSILLLLPIPATIDEQLQLESVGMYTTSSYSLESGDRTWSAPAAYARIPWRKVALP